MPGFQTKALVVPHIFFSGGNVMVILELSHSIVWLVRHVCSNKVEISFLRRKTAS